MRTTPLCPATMILLLFAGCCGTTDAAARRLFGVSRTTRAMQKWEHLFLKTRGGKDSDFAGESLLASADDGDDEEIVGDDPESPIIGVKSKKSNAVGDPDGSDDDSDDDDDMWEEFMEEEGLLDQVQVQVEYDYEDEEDDGGVGIRRHFKRKNDIEEHLVASWLPHVYLPPTNRTYLTSQARALDGDSKIRLDRRTLYACLLLEWQNTNARKFLEKEVSQALQAALSMASQPSWRQVSPRPSAIRLYDNHVDRGCTLAMQETIAMALAHSLGAGLVVLDDDVLASVRRQLLDQGYSEDDVKSGALIQSVLALAKQGALRSDASGNSSALISSCMRSDLGAGLDDPFDERATSSCEEMAKWEQRSWNVETDESTAKGRDLPLVIFLRAQRSTSLLKSKSAVDALLGECNASESRNLLVLGKGIDAGTVALPKDPEMEEQHDPSRQQSMQGLPGSAPWFSFTPQQQNAAGQNDPEGSRRFNIFLARTVDPNGRPGIVGAVAPPESGNLFPQMMAMQARLLLQQHSDDSPAKPELERWSQMLHQHMEQHMSNGDSSMPPPQFFNASLSSEGEENIPPPSVEAIQQTLENAMSELLDRLAQLNEEGATSPDLSPELQKAFAQVLRNENLRRGIAENLARAAPALSDPKCQGVLLSVYVPPPPDHMNHGKFPSSQGKQQPHSMGSWFQKMLNNHEAEEQSKEQTEESRRNSQQKRVRTMAAAAAVMAAEDARDNAKQDKVDRNLAKLETICRPIVVQTPTDPVRAKSWRAWIARERGAVVFRQNRRVLNEELEKHSLTLQEHTGTRGAGSSLRQMLSVRPIQNEEMAQVIRRSIELEALKSQGRHESPDETRANEMGLDVDITLSQLLLTDDGLVATQEILDASKKKESDAGMQFIHPSSLEAALSSVSKISSSPAGGLSLANAPAAHRSREEIAALAQDKHERALLAQVVSPQDIGVTYDMIGGLTDVKELLRQSITYPLKFPHLYSEGIAREAVKGVLLFGPPGTGKTMLAKAVATEGGASFLSVDASSVENKWLGESEKNAKAVFTLARRLAPCVIFIDEVDSLLSSREGSSDDSAHGTLTSVKTTMMSEWDGLNSGTNGAGEAGSDRVVVIGSTNRPFDLDEAVLRRFPRRILVDLPDLETRTEILEVTLSENRLDPSVNLTAIAERLEGYTGSDIKEVCREAVVQISHEQARLLDQGFANSKEDVTEGSLQRLRPVTQEDFEKALNKLKRSVSENGREISRVWEWNDQYGEIKKDKKHQLPHLANMFL